MGKKRKTHDEFLEDLKDRQSDVFDTIIEYIDKYESSQKHIRIRDKNGICSVKPSNLLSGKTPSIKSAVDKLEYLKGILRNNNPEIFNHVSKFYEYNGMLNHIYLDTKYGKCKMQPASMIGGALPSLKSAVDKNDYIKRFLLDRHPMIYDDIVEYGEYKGYHKKILVRNKYGWCSVKLSNLLYGKRPCIKSAIDPTSYWINMAKEVHGDFYNYERVNYVGKGEKVEIICPIHGPFWQKPDNHRWGYGCEECGILLLTGGYNKGNANKNKEEWSNTDAIVYIIEIYNETEHFYKVGITTREVEHRFQGTLPYEYRIVDEIKTNLYDAVFIENEMHKKNKINQYIPEIRFGGWTECFSSLFEYDNL